MAGVLRIASRVCGTGEPRSDKVVSSWPNTTSLRFNSSLTRANIEPGSDRRGATSPTARNRASVTMMVASIPAIERRGRRAILLGLLVALAFPAWAEVGVCDQHLASALSDVRIAAATEIRPMPTWQAPQAATSGRSVSIGTPFCRVEGVIEREIAFELWLPLSSNWNQRYLGVGNGGDAGFINYEDLARGVQRGFATASTDTGHVRTDRRWALNHPERVENFGHRAHHLLAERAKALTRAYYGKSPHHAYFMGCSGGGVQGLISAHRYPADYDGVISGAAGVGMLPLSARILATTLDQEKHPEHALTGAQWTGVFDTTVAACDAADSVRDGIVNEPAKCSFDPKRLACSASSNPQCLSPAQVRTVEQAYAPLRDANGVQIDPGFPPGVMYQPVPRQIGIAGLQFGDWTYQDETWNVRNFDLARDVAAARQKFWFLMLPQPDLAAFSARGGKLLSYHGWLDEIVPPALSIEVHENVRAALGERTAHFYRLFMAPGMQHCRRGNGPDMFGQAFAGDAPIVDAEHDMLAALTTWVEEGKAPARLIATRLSGKEVSMTRPLCPYPQRAVYKGRGSTNDAKNFDCRS